MADTSPYTSGYVNDIGITYEEGKEYGLGDFGTIVITPDPYKMLPCGIRFTVEFVPIE